MIIWTRTADISPGKIEQAFAWAVKVAAYGNKKYPSVHIQVLRNYTGPVYQLHWIAGHESLAAFEKWRKQLETDEGYRALLAEVREQGALKAEGLADALYEVVA